MAELKAYCEKIGLSKVITVLQTGNVVFESDLPADKLKRQIEEMLTESFGYPAKAQVLTIDALRKILAAYPFGTAGAAQHDYVIFVENGLETELVHESYELSSGEQVRAGDGVVYWRVDKGSTLRSAFAKQLAKTKYKDFNTNRNLKTLQKVGSL